MEQVVMLFSVLVQNQLTVHTIQHQVKVLMLLIGVHKEVKDLNVIISQLQA
jgi:hypothetical protein